MAFIDPEGPALLDPQTSALACNGVGALRAALAAALHIPARLEAVEFPNMSYTSAPSCRFDEDMSWFGLGGLLVVSVAVTWAAVGLMTRRMGPSWMLAVGATSYLLCASLLLRWQPWQGRLVIAMVALGTPVLGVLFQEMGRRRLWRLLAYAVVLYAAAGGLAAVVGDSARPLGAWGASRAAVQVLTRPQMGPVVARFARSVPDTARVGIFVNGDDWEFPLFGPHLDRTIEPLVPKLPPSAYPIPPATLPYVLTHQPDHDGGLLLGRLRLGSCRLAWSLAQRPGPRWRLYRCATGSGAGAPPSAGRMRYGVPATTAMEKEGGEG